MGSATLKAFTGSPPLARGIPADFEVMIPVVGITPACAGNTVDPEMVLWLFRDHPRLRGEYELEGKPPLRFWGSPPLARGILRF